MHTPIHSIGQPFMAIGGPAHSATLSAAHDCAPAVFRNQAAQARIADTFKKKRDAIRTEVDSLLERYPARHAAIIAAAQLQKSLAIEIGTGNLPANIAHENHVLRELLYVALVQP